MPSKNFEHGKHWHVEPGVVYAIVAEDEGRKVAVKIGCGFTRSMGGNLKAAKRGNHLAVRVLGVIPFHTVVEADYYERKVLHPRWKEFNTKPLEGGGQHEWFWANEELLAEFRSDPRFRAPTDDELSTVAPKKVERICQCGAVVIANPGQRACTDDDCPALEWADATESKPPARATTPPEPLGQAQSEFASDARTFSQADCHRRWWTVLPAIPPSREAVDWWASPGDPRSSRYQRLERAWRDKSLFQGTKEDTERPHWFSGRQYGLHASCAIWESFVLWHPRDFVPRLLEAACVAPVEDVSDACWSYEFQDRETRKTPDLVLHVRGKSEDAVFPVEAKFSKGDRLKEGDTPDVYCGLAPFRDISRRELLYLVQPKDADAVRTTADKSMEGYGVLTWSRLLSIQLSLAAECLPGEATRLVSEVLCQVAANLGIGVSSHDSVVVPTAAELGAAVQSHPEWPSHLREWMSGAACFVDAQSGDLPEPPFEYLAGEPSFSEFTGLPNALRGDAFYAEHWRLPSR